MHQGGGLGKSLPGEELPAVVDHRHFESELRSEADERHGVVTRPADDQAGAAGDDFDQEPFASAVDP